MCGILFSLRHESTPESSCIADTRAEVARRGPDSLNTISESVRALSGTLHISFTSSVLALRGHSIAHQPFINDRYIFCWNGQVFRGSEVGVGENDTAAVWREIMKADGRVDEVLARVEGPYAFILHDRYESLLTYGRDRLGRRSLLQSPIGTTSEFTISSVSPTGEVVESHGMQEVDCEWLWQLDVTKIEVDKEGKFDLNGAITRLDRVPEIALTPSADTYTSIPRLSRQLPTAIDLPTIPSSPSPPPQTIARFVASLKESVRLRVENIPRPVAAEQARLAILFSGGLDCAFLAHLIHECLPLNEPIDLLNVAFENPRAIAAAQQLRYTQAAVKADKVKRFRARFGNERELAEELRERQDGDAEGVAGGEGVYEVPDRVTGRETVAELTQIHPEREWRFVEIDITYQEVQQEKARVMRLMRPNDTEMDLSLALPLYFAARRRGTLATGQLKAPTFTASREDYVSHAKVLFSGLGADELLGGYARHRREFEMKGWLGAIDEMQMDLNRIPTRNLGRDDRIIASRGVETRFPYLDMAFISHVAALHIWEKCDLRFGEGVGDKSLLRTAAMQAGMVSTATRQKRAMQFGTRAARMEHEEKGIKRRGMGAQKIGNGHIARDGDG